MMLHSCNQGLYMPNQSRYTFWLANTCAGLIYWDTYLMMKMPISADWEK